MISDMSNVNLNSSRSCCPSDEKDDEDEGRLVLRHQPDGDAAQTKNEEASDSHPTSPDAIDRKEKKESEMWSLIDKEEYGSHPVLKNQDS